MVLGLALRFVHFGQDVPVGQGLIHWSYDLPFHFGRTSILTVWSLSIWTNNRMKN